MSSLSNITNAIMHTTDLARYLMLYKFGGIYLDLDFVTLNPISQYQNIVVTGKRKPGEWRVNLNF